MDYGSPLTAGYLHAASAGSANLTCINRAVLLLVMSVYAAFGLTLVFLKELVPEKLVPSPSTVTSFRFVMQGFVVGLGRKNSHINHD